MEYRGPTADDFANIDALNRLFLLAITDSGLDGFGEIAERQLTDSQLVRLAGTPFLLFSFREQDDEYWQRVLADDPQFDLMDSSNPPTEKFRALQTAGLSFLWHLSRRNPYAVRIVSGAPVSWCERLAGFTLVGLLERAATRDDVLGVRFPNEDIVWGRLLGNGISSKRSLRRTSHHCALQMLHTRGQQFQFDRIPTAACNLQVPVKRAAPRRANSFRDTKV